MTETKILTDEQIREIALTAGCDPERDDGVLVAQLIRLAEQAVLQSPEVVARQWQPIETAPHGETVLLGWRDWDGAWVADVGPATWGWRTVSVSNMSAHGQASHWMPLPTPPSDAAMEVKL